MIEEIYIGNYSNNIKICEFEDGKLKIVSQSEFIENPSYLHINNDILYAVSETKKGSISSFKIGNNSLINTSEKIIMQSLPCYITTNEARSSLLVANYESGSLIMYNLEPNGNIGSKKYYKSYNNANMHFAEFVGDNIYGIDLGNDNIYIYDINMELLSTIKFEPKSAPRHLVMSKDKKTIYVVTELSNQIYVFEKNKNEFKNVQKISTLENESIKSYAGAIKISKNNKNVYVTNRGHDSISVFAVDNGKLELIQNISTYGNFPRDIMLNENEKFLLVANQKSNNIVVYERNLNSGKLSRIKNADVIMDKPSCIVSRKAEV